MANADRPQIRRGLLLTAALMALLTAGAFLTTMGPTEARAGFGRWGHGHGHDPEQVRERVSFVAGWVLARVDATEEQEAAIQGILGETVEDLMGIRESFGGESLRDETVAQLTAETVDREALERLRQEKLRVVEAASARLVTALADIAEVLDRAQRQELADLVQRFHAHH